jgi:fucose permease
MSCIALPRFAELTPSIFLVYFVNSMQQQTTGQFLPYVTSAFSSHSLIPVIGIVSNIVTGVMKPPLAKILDVFGRFEGLTISLVCQLLGLVLMASCTSVQIYAAATIFYWVGYK